MKTIIVPTDFSPTAINAMNYAADMALEINASLLLLHMYQLPVVMNDAQIAVLSLEELKEAAEERLAKTKQSLEHITSGKIKIFAEVILGNVTDEVKAKAETLNPFAIVIGTKGLSAIDITLFGSNTLSIIKNIPWPVICVPKGKEYGKGIKKVGLATDFKDVKETLPAAAIATFITTMGATLHVLNVDHNNKNFKEDTPEQSLLLDTALGNLQPQYHFIEHEDIEDGINYFAETNNLDLIITIPKKQSFLDSLFKKSSSKQLIFQSHVPVMCIHE